VEGVASQAIAEKSRRDPGLPAFLAALPSETRRCANAGIALALGSYRVEALAIEVQKMLCIIFGSRNCATLEAGARSSGTSKSGGSSDKLHHVECDLFIATQGWSRGNGNGRDIAHGNSPRLN
jgi:hypothetical protein